MKINSKIRYGLRTMIEIASTNDVNGILQKDIAKNQSISLKYLDSIILSLKLKGLITNSKGKGSGYKLSKAAEEITIHDIYTAFEQITFVDCICNKKFCDRSEDCPGRDYWIEMKKGFENMLLKKTLAQIIDKKSIIA